MDDQKDKIIEALELMDDMDDEQWTADGAPKVDTVVSLSDLKSLTRADIINAAPKFSRADPILSEDDESSELEVEVNSQGRNHPEIIKAQKAYDKIITEEAQWKIKKQKLSDDLTEVTNRLMNDSRDKLTNQRNIMDVIKKSGEARAARVAGFQANRDLLMNQPPMSPLDEAKKDEKKTRPIMK